MSRRYICKICQVEDITPYDRGKLREYCDDCKREVVKARDRRRADIYNKSPRGREVYLLQQEQKKARRAAKKQSQPTAPSKRFSEKRNSLRAVYAKHGLVWDGGDNG